MIISHKHRFIFVKTTKTAGTSVELALSRICGPDDVITPVAPADEAARREMGGRPAQNFLVPFGAYRGADWWHLIAGNGRREYRNHTTAETIRRYVGHAVWTSYFKFSIERDPFDKAISRYYWSTQPPRPPLSEFLRTTRESHLSNWRIYAIDDRVAVDFVVRYERLAEDLSTVATRLGLPEIALPRAKAGHRESRAHYSSLLDADARARIELVCAREIAEFGYRWCDRTQELPPSSTDP
jgi:hypothetical protein